LALPYEEAINLIERFGDTGTVARHIVDQMITNPEAEDHWRAIASACCELLQATLQ
jgi:hypothetical protein